MTKGERRHLILGVDLGGTKVETALIDGAGNLISSEKYLTQPDKGPDGVIADIINCVEDYQGKTGERIYGLGVGMAGQVEKDTGVVRFSPNLRWHAVPLKSRLEKALKVPVVVNNDVRAATWAEWQYGAGRGVNDLVCLFVGTGIGGGIVSGGRLLDGCLNTAGELGHLTIVAGGRRCHCPNRGCLEAYAGGWAIAERAQEAVRNNPEAGQRLSDLAGSLENISAETVAQAYYAGDKLAGRLVEETVDYLAAGIVGILNALNPCLLVLGGGVITGLPEYLHKTETKIRASALETAVERLVVATASLGNKSVVIGAAGLARKRILENGLRPN